MDKRLQKEIEAFKDVESYAELMARPYTRALKEETHRRMTEFDFDRMWILEVGAGITEFEDLYKNSALICLSDINFKLLSENRDKAGVRIVCDGQYLPFKDGTFDYVIFIGVLHHFPDQEKGLAEASRIMKVGGRSFMVEPHRLSINYFYYLGRRLFLFLFGEKFVKKLIGCFTPDEVQLDVRAVKRIFRPTSEIKINTMLSFRLPPFRLFKKATLDVRLSQFFDRVFPFNKIGTTIFVNVIKKQ